MYSSIVVTMQILRTQGKGKKKEEQIYCFFKLFAKHTFYEKMCYNRILEVKP